jgi:hypothetical protein
VRHRAEDLLDPKDTSGGTCTYIPDPTDLDLDPKRYFWRNLSICTRSNGSRTNTYVVIHHVETYVIYFPASRQLSLALDKIT